VIDLTDWPGERRPAEVKGDALGHHPNALGQRLIAERLDAELAARPGLLPCGGGAVNPPGR
jgi:hypothetical protein